MFGTQSIQLLSLLQFILLMLFILWPFDNVVDMSDRKHVSLSWDVACNVVL